MAASSSESLLFQAGVYGAALFAVTALLRALSARLAEQERLARTRGRDLQNQLEINRLVIAQMDQGVIVVDRTTAGTGEQPIGAADARSRRAGAADRRPGWPTAPEGRELAAAFLSWVDGGRSEGAWSTTVVGVRYPVTASAESRLRARFARPTTTTSDEFVIFIEDVRDVEDRAQQLKLAAMGRLTASIAHEIRNPLAAISHAGQLLGEDASDPVLKRLASIVRENTQRLNRLVEDVLRVARREPPLGDQLEIAGFVRQFLTEFVRDRGLAARSSRSKPRPDCTSNSSNPICGRSCTTSSTTRCGSRPAEPGSVRVLIEPAPEGDRPQLWVFDDGPGVPFDARAALFEPFFTTRSQGTGLGLYLAREFCVTNRAELGYSARRELDGSTREGFLLRFGPGSPAGVDSQGFLDTIPVR